MTHYFSGQSGESFVDKTLHADADCEELSEPVRPLADSSVSDEQARCPTCAGERNTCDTVKADGDVCGRELPCPYHTN